MIVSSWISDQITSDVPKKTFFPIAIQVHVDYLGRFQKLSFYYSYILLFHFKILRISNRKEKYSHTSKSILARRDVNMGDKF